MNCGLFLYILFLLNWEKTFGGNGFDEGKDVKECFDGGYIIVGSTSSFGQGLFDVYLIRTDENGETLWTKTYGGQSNDRGYSILQTRDSGYIIVGNTQSFGNGSSDVWIIRLNKNGELVWSRTYGGTYADGGLYITKTSDSCYVISGYTKSFSNNLDADLYLLKIDENGNLLWERNYGLRGFGLDEFGYCVKETHDNELIVVGYGRFPYGHGVEDVRVLKTNSEGETLWTKIFGGELADYGYSVLVDNNNFLFAGYTGSFAWNVYLIKTDNNGNLVFERSYGGTGYDVSYSIIKSFNNNYLLVGSTESFGSGANDIYLLEVDENGNIVWTRTFGGTSEDIGYSVIKTNDSCYLIVGYTLSYSSSVDVYLIKFSYSSALKENKKEFKNIKKVYNILGQPVHIETNKIPSGIYFSLEENKVRIFKRR
ncbi:MAG: hypothetical protein ABIK76_04850 [candidate division WOR-3 bacterium]